MKLSEIISNYRRENNLSMDEFAARCGLSKPYISMLEKNRNSRNGKPIIPSIRTYEKIALGLNITVDSLLRMVNDDGRVSINRTIKNLIPVKNKQIPVLGTIAAGKPIYADEHLETYVPCDSSMHVDFALKVKGDSMINAGINDGDIVFIKKQPTVENGQIAAVLIDDEATLKHVYYTGDSCTLIADNPKYPPMVFNSSNCDTFQILGLAIATLSMITY